MTADRFARVRIKPTGQVGKFFMRTYLPGSKRFGVWVHFEETDEFGAYREADVEYLTD